MVFAGCVVVGINEGWTGMLVDGYPWGANSIGSSPSSSRFGDYSAMVVVGTNILLTFLSTLSSNSPQYISTLSIK